jgi:hypothetical protein
MGKITFMELAPTPTVLMIVIFFQIFTAVITAFYMIAWLNVVFTYNFFTTSNYPTYSDTLYMGLGTFWTDRYYPDWWIVLSDTIYFVVIIQQALSVATVYTLQIPARTFNMFVLAVFTFIKIITLGIRLYEITFCDKFNICRGDPPDPLTPNPVFIYMLTMNFVWVLFLFIYGLLWYIGVFETSFYNFLEELGINLDRYRDRYLRRN